MASERKSSFSHLKDVMARRWARKLERWCCQCVTLFPLLWVYGLTTWAAYTVVQISYAETKVTWLGSWTALGGFLLYALTNWSYTVAVFTPPGSTTIHQHRYDNDYTTLPTYENEHELPNGTTIHDTGPPNATSLTVKANGEMRFCKKCRARKPDRAHHCSTCQRCVLMMDHHCPWLATCIGLRNHKAFLLFLIYTPLLALFCFVVTGAWVLEEVMDGVTYVDTWKPINFIMLCVVSGIIALVVGLFAAWHVWLAARGQTTIECLERTRYLSPLRKSLHQAHKHRHQLGASSDGAQESGNDYGNGLVAAIPQFGQQLLDIHQNALPGVTRPEEGEEILRQTSETHHNNDYDLRPSQPRYMTYSERERLQARESYNTFMDEQDSDSLPNAFDLGWRRNLSQLFGPRRLLWAFPICNSVGDGWVWEPSPKWLAAREQKRRAREEQRAREDAAGWGAGAADFGDGGEVEARRYAPPEQHQHRQQPKQQQQKQYLIAKAGRRTPSKADRILGRDPDMYLENDASAGIRMQDLAAAASKRRGMHDVDSSDDDYYKEADDDVDNGRPPPIEGGEVPVAAGSNGIENGDGNGDGAVDGSGPSNGKHHQQQYGDFHVTNPSPAELLMRGGNAFSRDLRHNSTLAQQGGRSRSFSQDTVD